MHDDVPSLFERYDKTPATYAQNPHHALDLNIYQRTLD